jgi:hypothetical protein
MCGEKRKALLKAEFGEGKAVDKPQKTVDRSEHLAHPLSSH